MPQFRGNQARKGCQIMNYKETLEYIQSLSKYGSVLGLDSMLRLCEKLGNPEQKSKFIHVAGTNGKGSTSAYIAHMLMAAGYRVGRYISPTITDYRERFQIGNRMITQKDLCLYMERIKAVCEEIVLEGHPHPTPFEVETALCFLYFAEKECDFVVLEVGMGGETDATNVIPTPIACIWTSISMDHMGFLGNSLSAIAGVKSGIAKKGALLISCKQEPEVEQVLLHKAEQVGASLVVADVAKATAVKYGLTTQQFSYKELAKLKLYKVAEPEEYFSLIGKILAQNNIKGKYDITNKDGKKLWALEYRSTPDGKLLYVVNWNKKPLEIVLPKGKWQELFSQKITSNKLVLQPLDIKLFQRQ